MKDKLPIFQHPFYFLRHGETVWNKARITQGQSNSRLNTTGRRQAQKAGELLKNEPIERIVSSPLVRASDTAKAVARHHNIDIVYDDDLKECHWGRLQGTPHRAWLNEYWEGRFTPPDGETFEQFAARVWHAMARAVALGPNTLIVAHGGLWIAAHHYTTITPSLMPMPNALPLHITVKDGTWHHHVLTP